MIKLVKAIWSAIWLVFMFGIGALLYQSIVMSPDGHITVDFNVIMDLLRQFLVVCNKIKNYCLFIVNVLYF
jgi:hypothetical protein